NNGTRWTPHGLRLHFNRSTFVPTLQLARSRTFFYYSKLRKLNELTVLVCEIKIPYIVNILPVIIFKANIDIILILALAIFTIRITIKSGLHGTSNSLQR